MASLGTMRALCLLAIGCRDSAPPPPPPSISSPPPPVEPRPDAAIVALVDATVENAPAIDAAAHRLSASEGRIAVDPAPALAIGSTAKQTISVSPGPGYQINMDLTPRLEVVPPGGLEMAPPAIERWDAQKLVIAVAITAREPGDYSLNGMLKFAVCRPDACFAKDEPIALPLVVTP